MRWTKRDRPRETEQSRLGYVTDSVQMKKHEYSTELPDLAALLDGEILDEQRLLGLSAKLAEDSGMNAEFAEQRQIKSMLGSLPEYEAPAYLATRVMGEIAARRKISRQQRFKPWLAAAGGFATCLLLAGLLFTPFSPLKPVNTGAGPTLAKGEAGDLVNGELVRSLDGEYLQGTWSEQIPVADGENLDPQMKEFLEFINEAHAYRVMMRQGTAVSPDLPEAVMVLGEPQPAGE